MSAVQSVARRAARIRPPAPSRVRRASMADVGLIDVREAERIEFWDGYRHTPEEAVAHGIASGDAYVIDLYGEPAGVFGVVPTRERMGVGVPWAALSDAVARHPITFLRASRREMAGFQHQFYALWNVVDARNVQVVKWLAWLGFTIYPAEAFGPDRKPFHRFGWEAPNV